MSMYLIEESMIRAINSRKPFSQGNTRVEIRDDCIVVWLHNTEIAVIVEQYLYIRNCGYNTKTTKSRLNAILTLLPGSWSIRQNDYQWFLANDILWDDDKWYVFDRKTGTLMHSDYSFLYWVRDRKYIEIWQVVTEYVEENGDTDE